MAGESPYFLTPNGLKRTLEVINNIPYLSAEEQYACPAAASVSAGAAARKEKGGTGATKRKAADVDSEIESSSSEERGRCALT
jgi:hypothetical protein